MGGERVPKNNQIKFSFTWVHQPGFIRALLIIVVFIFPCICSGELYDITMGSPYEYDEEKGGRNNIMVGLDDFHYLCLYAGYTGKAVILTVNPADWTMTSETTYQYDENGDYMGISEIDEWHFLITYCGDDESSYASVISINPVDWSITTETTVMYDYEFGYYNALSKIDDTHYLGVHNMYDVTGRAGVFTVDTNNWSIVYGTEYNFEPEQGYDFMLCRIDDTHHLCVYPSQGDPYGGRAVVLIVETSDWTVTTTTSPFTFATDCDAYSFLSRIDDTHFLCAYEGSDSDGWAVVLTVNSDNWSVNMEVPFEYDSQLGGEPNLSRINNHHYLCAYKGEDADGYAVVLAVDSADWSISKETPFEFDETRADYPYLCRIDDARHLCSYEGPGLDGWAVVLVVELSGVGATKNEMVSADFNVANYPNPFNPSTMITFSIPEDSKVELSIFNLKGQLVRTLIDYSMPAGGHSALWNGDNEIGLPVNSGIYFYYLNVNNNFRAVKQCLLLK